MKFYIKVGSITSAQRGRDILLRSGVKSSVKRLDNPEKGDGCGYVLVLSREHGNAVDLLKKNGIRVLGVYQE